MHSRTYTQLHGTAQDICHLIRNSGLVMKMPQNVAEWHQSFIIL